MAWKIELSKEADKSLAKLDPSVARRILTFLHKRVARYLSKLIEVRGKPEAIICDNGPKYTR